MIWPPPHLLIHAAQTLRTCGGRWWSWWYCCGW
jgi:hypothetical protein